MSTTGNLARVSVDPAPFLALARDRQARTDNERAGCLGVSRETVFRWRHGATTTMVVADRICTHLGRHIDEFLAGSTPS